MSQKQAPTTAQALPPLVRLVLASTQCRLESRQSSPPKYASQCPECPESIAPPRHVASACEAPRLRSCQASTPGSPQQCGSTASSPTSSRCECLCSPLGRQQQFLKRGPRSGSESAPLVGRHQDRRLGTTLCYHLRPLSQAPFKELAEPSLSVLY